MNKFIRIANKSQEGWTTVIEHESDDLASNFDDVKRMRQVETRALRTVKEKRYAQPYQKPATTVFNSNRKVLSASSRLLIVSIVYTAYQCG